MLSRSEPVRGMAGLFVAVAWAALAAACTGDLPDRPVPEPEPRPAYTPQPVVFPDDFPPHDYRLEWWYYNGHLVDEAGGEYGFHFVIFQARSPGEEPLYAAHFSVSEPASGRHEHHTQVFVGAQPQPDIGLALDIAGWNLGIGEERHSIDAAAEEESLSLTLEPLKPAALHNEIGWLPGPFGWTYYYSWTRMQVSGQVRVGGRELDVNGQAWMDHQWGDFFVLGHPAGWQWFAIQLDDGTDLMITESRGTDGEVIALYGTVVGPEGEAGGIDAEEGGIRLDVLDTWTSPHTGGEYPAGWRLRVETLDLDLELRPLIADQEVLTQPASAIYWEGKISVEGTREGEPVSGNAYVELVGYAVPPPLSWR